MKLLSTTLLATSLVISSAAIASTSNGMNLSVSSLTGDQAVVKVTQDGEPLANYPVEIKGFGAKQAMTDENGVLVVSNVAGSGMNYVFTVQDKQGNEISEDAFLANKRR
ncbi:hypothetical protein [Vibrio algivorus]|uniref:DUF4198 domain-containing protein n=1 Tax=Vibrio algivorus TaxID=1667024 RepID=A0A557NY44_9VIBR|nr:hypothetical protein [Vibrio algivorus]TVO33318.1 DUF4198 domain-containing protein [Vibrio algivorus]GLT13381.1 hypothetical protein GCM10007931_03550 [Vibrio algivorus]